MRAAQGELSELEELAVGAIQMRGRLRLAGPVFGQPLFFAAAHREAQRADLSGEHQAAEQLFRHRQHHGACGDAALVLFEFFFGAEVGEAGWPSLVRPY